MRHSIFIILLLALGCSKNEPEAQPKPEKTPIVLPTPKKANHHPSPHGSKKARSLDLTVELSEQGIVVSSRVGAFASGCQTLEKNGAPTIDLVDGAYSWSALTICAKNVKKAFSKEDTVKLVIGPKVDSKAVDDAVTALKGDENMPLFPNVTREKQSP